MLAVTHPLENTSGLRYQAVRFRMTSPVAVALMEITAGEKALEPAYTRAQQFVLALVELVGSCCG